MKTCAPRPEDRFQTPAELKQALVYYMQRNEVSDTLIVPPSSRRRRRSRPRRRRTGRTRLPA